MSAANAFTLWSRGHTVLRDARARSLVRALWAIAAIGFSIAFLRRVSSLGDLRTAWAASAALGPSLLLLLALPAVGHFVKMLGWRGLLPAEQRPPLLRAYATFIAAQAVNELGLSVLGEPLKVITLPARARGVALRAVVVDNLSALLALLVLSAALLLGGLGAVPLALGLVALLLPWLREGKRRWLLAFGAHYIGKSWLIVEIAVGLSLLGVATLAPVAPLCLALLGSAALGAPVPLQLGVAEAALVASGAALGLAKATLLTLALIRRVRGLLWLLLGLLLAAHLVHRHRSGDSDVSITRA